MRAKEFIKEIKSGELNNPNIPDFTNAKHECDIDGYQVMSAVWNGYYVLGILDENNKPKSYVIVEPENNGLCKFREIYTDPIYRRLNLAAIILMALKKLNIKLLLDVNEVVSDSARKLILSMVKNGRLQPSLLNGTTLSYNELKDIFDIAYSNKYSIILEGEKFMDWERRYRKDEVLSERWRLRGPVNIARELYED